jgi:hypothetical protein
MKSSEEVLVCIFASFLSVEESTKSDCVISSLEHEINNAIAIPKGIINLLNIFFILRFLFLIFGGLIPLNRW